MKFGLRQPSFKKSLKARTTGKAKRKIKKSLIPGYGKKGTGMFKDPKKRYIIKSIIRPLFESLRLFLVPPVLLKRNKQHLKNQMTQ